MRSIRTISRGAWQRFLSRMPGSTCSSMWLRRYRPTSYPNRISSSGSTSSACGGGPGFRVVEHLFIRDFGRTVLVLAPWHGPERGWCLFDIYSTIVAQSRFEVAMTQSLPDRYRFGSQRVDQPDVEQVLQAGRQGAHLRDRAEWAESTPGFSSVCSLFGEDPHRFGAEPSLSKVRKLFGWSLYESGSICEDSVCVTCSEKRRVVLGESYLDTIESLERLRGLLVGTVFDYVSIPA